jgi:tRNA(Ile2)-agmatinylcytidine synthase
VWVGVDDTDGPDGGCTTFVLTELLELARSQGLDLLGWPRLVRLNPNVPYKTRGNGAMAVRLGHGRGVPRPIGEIAGRPVLSYPAGRPARRAERERFLAAAAPLVDRLAAPGEQSDPVLVVADGRPSRRLYRSAVARLVPIAEAREAWVDGPPRVWSRGPRRGFVGASAAIAWRPGRRTFELLAYRRPERIGRPREIDRGSVARAVARFPGLVLCEDPRTRRLLIAPHTDCPILFGLRARTPAELPAARAAVRSEPVERWLLFETNQGTGDHWMRRRLAAWPRLASGSAVGLVADLPEVLEGGHVRFLLRDGRGRRSTGLAFEPGKTLPKVVASLRPGDRVRVDGGRARDGSIHVERLTVLALADRPGSLGPPRCAACRRTAGSLGRGRGYRCPGCRRRFPPEAAVRRSVPVPYPPGTYEPVLSARRHLHALSRDPANGAHAPAIR